MVLNESELFTPQTTLLLMNVNIFVVVILRNSFLQMQGIIFKMMPVSLSDRI